MPKATQAPEPPLKEKVLPASYKDEDKKVGWRSAKPDAQETDKVTTRYFSEQEKVASRVSFDAQGRMLDAQGKPVRSAQDIGFVMDPKTKQIHQFDATKQHQLPGDKRSDAASLVAALGWERRWRGHDRDRRRRTDHQAHRPERALKGAYMDYATKDSDDE